MATIRARITRTGQTRYHVQVRLKGHAPATASFARRTDAKHWAQQTEAAMRDGRYFPSHAAQQHTLAEAIDRYSATVLPCKRPNTIAPQRVQLAWWRARLGHLRLRDLTPAVLVECREVLLAQFQPGTVVHYLSRLNHLCTLAAREWQWLEDNPVRRISKPREPCGRVRFLSDAERARLLAVCQAYPNPRLYPLVFLALSTGMRKTELLTLRWSAVDLARRVITLQETKNGERRSIPLTGAALEALHQLGKVRRLDTDLLFPAQRKPQNPMPIDTVWQIIKRRANLEDFRFHDLRHSCASYLAMSGASLLDIATILGHKTLHMAQRYSHLSAQHTVGVLQRMTQAVFGETGHS